METKLHKCNHMAEPSCAAVYTSAVHTPSSDVMHTRAYDVVFARTRFICMLCNIWMPAGRGGGGGRAPSDVGLAEHGGTGTHNKSHLLSDVTPASPAASSLHRARGGLVMARTDRPHGRKLL